MSVMFHDFQTECLLYEFTRCKQRSRFPERPRHAWQRLCFVHIPFEDGRWLDLPLDTVESRGESGRYAKVWIRVGPRNAALDSEARALAHHPETCGPVVVTPGEARRRPRTRAEAFVRIHRRRVQ